MNVEQVNSNLRTLIAQQEARFGDGTQLDAIRESAVEMVGALTEKEGTMASIRRSVRGGTKAEREASVQAIGGAIAHDKAGTLGRAKKAAKAWHRGSKKENVDNAARILSKGLTS